MNSIPYLQRLLMLALNIVLPAQELDQGEQDRRLGDETRAAVRRYLAEKGLGLPAGMGEETDEWIQWITRRLEEATKNRFLIFGEIREAAERLLPGLTVRAFDRDLPSLERRAGSGYQLLGEAVSNGEGRFAITYGLERFSEGESEGMSVPPPTGPHADLTMQVFDETGQQLTLDTIRLVATNKQVRPDKIIFNAPRILEVAINVLQDQTAKLTEYERVIARVAPIIKDIPLAELTDEDVEFIVNELSRSPDQPIEEEAIKEGQHVRWLRCSALLSDQSGVSVEAFYGWGRVDLPEPFEDLFAIPSDKLSGVLKGLIGLGDAARSDGLLRATDASIIPARLREQVDAINRLIRQARPVARLATGRLIDEGSGEPLASLFVAVSAAAADSEPAVHDSDARGLFPILGPPAPVGERRRLRLTVRDVSERMLLESEIEIVVEDPRIVDVRVPLPAVPEREGHALSALPAAGVDIPPALLDFLAANGIGTLADIRRRGPLARLDGLPVPADDPLLPLLEAHANLSLASADTRINAALIDRGFDSIAAIGDAPRAQFVTTTHERIGDFQAGRLHAVARAQSQFLDAVVAGVAAERATGYAKLVVRAGAGGPGPDAEDIALGEDVLGPERCACSDCETAVSPSAYLADLLLYTLRRVTAGGAPIDMQELTDTFRQPFADLPTDCGLVEARVRQVRICVETLRLFLGARPLADAVLETELDTAERAYRLSAYQTLLARIGSSYAELRLANSADGPVRQALADRLQVPLAHLDDLYLDPADSAHLTEARLEELFGLVDTHRNPLAPSSTPQLLTWRRASLRASWRQQDFFIDDLYEDGSALAALKRLPAGIVFPPALDPRIEHDMASQILSFQGQMSLDDRATLLGLSADDRYQQAVRALYRGSQRLPIIDPDVVGPDDLREPFPGKAAFDLWRTRRTWVDDRLDAFAAMTKTKIVDEQPVVAPDVEGMLAAMYAPLTYDYHATTFAPWPAAVPLTDFELMHTTLELGDEAVRSRIEDELNLTVEGFGHLLSLRAKHAAWVANSRSQRVTAVEARDLRSILTQAQKARFFLTWREEERTTGITLNPETFWISLTQPAEGVWPPEMSGVPYIDPDLVEPNELPDPIVGERALAFRTQREKQLSDIRAQLRLTRETVGFDAMLRDALGDPDPGNALQHDLASLRDGLNSNDPNVVDETTRRITNDLYLPVESFIRLMTLQGRDGGPAADRPTAAEWEEAYTILVPARKAKHEYPAWLKEEQAPATGIAYWGALKALLPPWRCPAETRGAWQAGLRARSGTCTLDPDLVAPGDLRNPAAGDPAFDFLQQRETDIAVELAALRAEPRTFAGFDNCLMRTLGISVSQLIAVAERADAGHRIGPRLDQLSLDFAAFNLLVRLARLFAAAESVLDSEWGAAHDILVQVWKRRKAALWFAQEKDKGVVLEPDCFATPVTALPQLSVSAWRSPTLARRDWQDKLQTRIDQETTVAAALADAVGVVEEQTLPQLRDALIAASPAPAAAAADPQTRFEQRAKWLGDNLLIDTKTSGCAITTRIAQAIETIQGLIQGLRSGQLEGLFKTWLLDLTHFDDEWKWMGSYPTWRSAMLVFLYPEHLLQPGLRHHQSYGLRRLIDSTRQAITPDDACAAARQYSEYFEDVSAIRIDVTCLARTRLHESGACSSSASDERCFFYMFGRGRKSGRAYWSRYDFQTGAGHAQSFWEPIEHQVSGFDNIVEILGAVPFQVSTGDRFIFVFAKRRAADSTTLVCAKFDLNADRWSPEMLSIDHPMGSADFTAVVKQTDSEREEPHVLFYGRVNDGAPTLYRERRIDAAGSGWEDGDFRPLYLERHTKSAPVAMVRFRNDAFLLFVVTGSSAHLCFPNPNRNQPNRYLAESETSGGVPSSRFVGAFTWQGVDGVFRLTSYHAPGIASSTVGYHRLQLMTLSTQNTPIASRELTSPFPDDSVLLQLVDSAERAQLLPTWGSTDDSSGKQKRFIYRSALRAEHHRPLLIRDVNTGAPIRFDRDTALPVRPDITGPFDIPVGLADNSLALRRTLEATAFSSIASYPSWLKVYLEEAYFWVPVALAIALHRSGEYPAALDWFRTVYADGTALASCKIYPGLIAEESLLSSFKRAPDWLLDPLDPHTIAATRRNACTRFTVLAIVRCLLDYADHEFTRDTAESNALARRLYLRALELLESPELQQGISDQCEDVIGSLDDLADERWTGALHILKTDLRGIAERTKIVGAVTRIREALQSDLPIAQRFARARSLVAETQAPAQGGRTLKQMLQDGAVRRSTVQHAAVRHDSVVRALSSVGYLAATDFQRAISVTTGIVPSRLVRDATKLTWLREARTHASVSGIDKGLAVGTFADGIAMDVLVPSQIANLALAARSNPNQAMPILSKVRNGFVPAPMLGFCIPRDPIPGILRTRAEVNLRKLRSCRNIAGLKRALEPYAGPTDASSGLPVIGMGGQLVLPGVRSLPPTLYRYATLVERAKQLVQLAAQIEGAMLAALQRKDEASLALFRARQDLDLAAAGVRLHDLHVTASKSRIEFAKRGESRAQAQYEHFEKLIADGISESENLSMLLLEDAVDFIDTADDLQVAAAVAYFSKAGSEIQKALANGGGLLSSILEGSDEAAQGLSAIASAFSTRAQIRSTRSSIHSMKASFERRQQEWEYQRDLANEDIAIAAQQTQIANDEAAVVEQEREIARIQQTHARDTVTFLTTGIFGTAALYGWMSDVLQGVYRFFLQQATAMARLAENQLAFERQETPPAFVQTDYWQYAGEASGAGVGSSAVDRRGLTGSARLLQDIYQLDQYAFETKKRKLQLSKIISLARLAPIEFQQFRETGVMTFATPMELFDRDFPGHYLRLISRIGVSVAALIPPSQGIHAELTSTGLSRVVIGPEVFQRIPIRREPETLALSSPTNATGVFDLELQGDMLRPFEGSGVDTIWELRMPRAANQFDFLTIADVLVTMDYTALNSFDYRQQVIASLPATLKAEASFSFRNQFSDQWYDLHNPEQTSTTPMTVVFSTLREDFPPNLDRLRIDAVALYFSRSENMAREIAIDRFLFREYGSAGSVGAGARTIQGLINTRLGSGAGWNGMVGRSPVGDWELALPNTQEMRDYFTSGDIRDILFVISFAGSTPPWPK